MQDDKKMKPWMWLLLGTIAVLSFFLWVSASQAADPAPGSLDEASLAMIDAVQVGSLGAILAAFVQILKTPLVLRFLGPLLAQIGLAVNLSKLSTTTQPVVTGDSAGINPMVLEVPKAIYAIPGKATPALTIAVGLLGGVAQGLLTGQRLPQALVYGAVSSGAAMGLYDLILKPFTRR